MQTLCVMISNQNGLHARPAKCLVQKANEFASNITVQKGEESEPVNAKSILGLLSIGASYGTELTFRIDGPDENAAALAVKELFDGNGLND